MMHKRELCLSLADIEEIIRQKIKPDRLYDDELTNPYYSFFWNLEVDDKNVIIVTGECQWYEE